MGSRSHWESPLTDWGRPIEATSHGEAEDIARRYRDVILQQRSQCLGSYIFLWGQKQERTDLVWAVRNDRRTEAVDVMERLDGHWPEQRCPQIEDLLLNRKPRLRASPWRRGQSSWQWCSLLPKTLPALFWQVREEWITNWKAMAVISSRHHPV